MGRWAVRILGELCLSCLYYCLGYRVSCVILRLLKLVPVLMADESKSYGLMLTAATLISFDSMTGATLFVTCACTEKGGSVSLAALMDEEWRLARMFFG
jgi:hypothetical protein